MSTSEPFHIKHLSSGRYVHPHGGGDNPINNAIVNLHSDIHPNMIWRFLPVKYERGKDEWGYIEHLSSGKILHPFGGGHDPWDETHLVLHRDRHRGALFKIDQVNNHIIHMSGKYVHPRFGRSDAGNYTQVTLHSNLHKHMEFRCFSIDNPNKTFLVYGAPIVGGEWKIIHKAINPTVDCTLAIDVKLGCASAEKVRETERFKYRWEASFGVENVEYFSQSASQLLKHYIGVSSPQTWEDETTTKIEVKYIRGEKNITWQYVFTVRQNDSELVFHSDLFADTDGEGNPPRS